MAGYKCIFCDVDGTLLDSQCRIPPKTADIIKRAVASGIPFILVSARMPQAMTPFLAELQIEAPIISYNGALTLSAAGEVLESVEIPAEAASELYHYASGNFDTVNCSIYRGFDWVVDSFENPHVKEESRIVSVVPEVADIEGYLKRCGSVHKVFCIGDEADAALLYARLKEISVDVRPAMSAVNYIEITAVEASKSAAVRSFCEREGISESEIIAFGDNYNDVDMLKHAGMGVGMGNAPADVQAAADMVTSSNDQEGIYEALKKLLDL